MREKIKQDERILLQKQKLSSEAFIILMIILIISIPIQHYLFNAPFSQYCVEFIALSIVSIYIIIRYLIIGMDIFDETKMKRRKVLIYSLLTGLVVTVINGMSNYYKYIDKYKDNLGLFIASLFFVFVSVVIITLAILAIIYFINDKNQKQIEKDLDDDEQNIKK